jgi:thymidylate kinase
MRPTGRPRTGQRGLFVLIVGPDGAGKSTLAGRLAAADRRWCDVHQMHWRPQVLPRLGAFVGRSPGDPSTPHARPPRSSLLSLLLLAYYWFDFFLGSWLKIRPSVRRGALVIMERGWFDFAVDPRRYRMRVSPVVVRLLGRLLSRPDLALVLDASDQTLLSRKTELHGEELSRQMELWRAYRFPPGTRKEVVDASRPFEEVLQAAREAVERLRPTPPGSGPLTGPADQDCGRRR